MALKKRYTFIDLFAGCGGLSEGFYRQGFKALAHVEIDHWACETLRTRMKFYGYKDYDKAVIEHDITSEDILETIDDVIKGKPVDIIIGGPPCQAYSTAGRVRDGKRMATDPRNYLFESYVKILEHFSPKFFVFENVTGLLSARVENAPILPRVLKALGSKYKVLSDPTILVHNTADFGVPQTRVRFITVGIRKDLNVPFSIPSPTVTEWATVGSVSEGIPEPPADYSEHPDYPNHQNARVTKENIFRFSFVPQGGGWKDIPFEHRLPCHQRVDSSKGGWPDCFGRLEWNGQAPTITGGFDSFTRGRYGHPLHDRPLTPREAARIQGFPDNFRFYGTRAEVRKQIGNAVPPPLAKAIGEAIIRCLLKVEI